jgi:hypothetical protein
MTAISPNIEMSLFRVGETDVVCHENTILRDFSSGRPYNSFSSFAHVIRQALSSNTFCEGNMQAVHEILEEPYIAGYNSPIDSHLEYGDTCMTLTLSLRDALTNQTGYKYMLVKMVKPDIATSKCHVALARESEEGFHYYDPTYHIDSLVLPFDASQSNVEQWGQFSYYLKREVGQINMYRVFKRETKLLYRLAHVLSDQEVVKAAYDNTVFLDPSNEIELMKRVTGDQSLQKVILNLVQNKLKLRYTDGSKRSFDLSQAPPEGAMPYLKRVMGEKIYKDAEYLVGNRDYILKHYPARIV